MENKIDTVLSTADLQAIQAKLSEIRALLPFLLDTPPKDNRGLAKMGDKSIAFVQIALEGSKQRDDFLPRSFDVASFERDVVLYDQLYGLKLGVDSLNTLLSNTLIRVGAEAYRGALSVYDAAKRSGDASLKPLVDDLSTRFKGMGNPGETPGEEG